MALRLEDRDLVIAYQAGDDEAFAELVREYRPELLNHARRRLSCHESAEDAVQETLVRALRAMPRFNGNYRVKPWLHRILANVCIDEGNRRRRESEKTERAAVNGTALQPTPSVETELGLDIDLSDIADAVEGLSEPYREALELRFVEELSYDEMAKATGVSEDNARARVSRARSALRAALRVAAFVPVALVGLLRRGERAASAVAGHGSGAAQSSVGSAMPLLTETAPVASRAAAAVANAATVGVPMVAKAAVGLGLATAVISPTADSTVHKAAERVLPDSVIEVLTPLAVEVPPPDAPVVVPAAEQPPVVESAPAAAKTDVTPAVVAAASVTQEEAAATAVEPQEAAVVAVEPQEAVVVAVEPQETAVVAVVQEEAPLVTVTDDDTSLIADSTSADSNSSVATAVTPDVSESEGGSQVVDQTVTESETSSVAVGQVASETESSTASEPVVTAVATSNVEGAELTFTPSGADRYDVSGTLSLTVTTTTTTTTDDGETVETDTMSKSVAVVVPSTASLQAADPAVDERRFSALLVFAPGDDGVSAEMRLAARGSDNGDGSLSMTGVFTATPTEPLPLAERGTLSGTLTLDADGMPQSLTVTLTQ
ncbi:sigma-70 family RNA polymerase sigma factor [Candidatus Poriferisodalis sp.]|uniref:RNA polymerase sigma factor n=1 Tax=Candidatus Poriferisodalis sp. TaxID=3101277 RepID=UPI003AF561E8